MKLFKPFAPLVIA